MHSVRRLTTVLLVGLVCLSGAAAQTEAPAWLRIQNADRHAASGEYGRAIQLYREALTLDRDNPEALFGLGRAFKSVNDYDIAEEYLLGALENAADLALPAMIYEINYELASLYEVRRAYADLQAVLLRVIELAEAEPKPPRTIDLVPDTLRRSLRDEGLDRLLVLYRDREDGATRARGDLCRLFTGLGRYEPAVAQGLSAVVQQLTTVIDAVISRDPLFEFSTVAGVLNAARNYPETRAYLATGSLNANLYYLATALYSLGDPAAARALWQLLAGFPDHESYVSRARIQLADPLPEPLLVPQR